MDSKVPCIACGEPILPATAERTGGKCMPCFNDHDGIRPAQLRIQAAQLLGERTPTDTLLHMIEQALTDTVLRVASSAAGTLDKERIYGCWLFHTHFQFVDGLTIFTEATSRAGFRWSLYDTPHHLYLRDEFDHTDHLLLALEQRGGGEAIASAVECVCLRVLRRLRDASVFGPHVLLTLAEGDQGYAQRYAYAGLFSGLEALEGFRADVEPLNWQHLEHWRS